MKRRASLLLVALVSLALAACAGRGPAEPPPASSPAAGQPYAGLQERSIKALAPERVADLLDGRGAGYALAAELNHYPGPTHVLEHSASLQLRPEQEQAARQVYGEMRQQAQELGERLVALEAELDQGFRGGSMSEQELERLTRAIAAVEGDLRRTHLAAHLKIKEILSPDQIGRYDALRGYGDTAESSPPSQGQPAHDGSGGHPRQH